jgi:bifunctional UDP-N-acetylglucosamine pyrophosphorylase/glucosamine-1-phosphate N-acetyltransferase
MAEGVTLVAPETVFLCADTCLSPDVLIEPHVVFGPDVIVHEGATIRSFSHLEGCEIHAGSVIGPYARIRPGSSIGAGSRVGNFVEIKATTMGTDVKVNHLSYLGDSRVGNRTNIGAGTITCNYDGTFKHSTLIGHDVFVGSDSVLVAPLNIGDNALIGAGSVITTDVPPDALALGRARQINKDEQGKRFKDMLRAKKENG